MVVRMTSPLASDINSGADIGGGFRLRILGNLGLLSQLQVMGSNCLSPPRPPLKPGLCCSFFDDRGEKREAMVRLEEKRINWADSA